MEEIGDLVEFLWILFSGEDWKRLQRGFDQFTGPITKGKKRAGFGSWIDRRTG